MLVVAIHQWPKQTLFCLNILGGFHQIGKFLWLLMISCHYYFQPDDIIHNWLVRPSFMKILPNFWFPPLTHWAPGDIGSNFESVISEHMPQIYFMGIYEIVLRWMPQDTCDHKSTMVQVMAWCRQATSHYLSQCWLRSMPIYAMASLGYTELAEVYQLAALLQWVHTNWCWTNIGSQGHDEWEFETW